MGIKATKPVTNFTRPGAGSSVQSFKSQEYAASDQGLRNETS